MTVTLLKSKLHRIVVTESKLDYTGSLTLDEDLMDAVGILNYEKLLVANVDNGERFETYAIRGPRGSGVCCLNGAAAHKGKVGDRLIGMTWALMPEEEARAFFTQIQGMKATQITAKVNQLVVEKKISDMSQHRDLWTVLDDCGLYDKSESNWNQQVR